MVVHRFGRLRLRRPRDGRLMGVTILAAGTMPLTLFPLLGETLESPDSLSSFFPTFLGPLGRTIGFLSTLFGVLTLLSFSFSFFTFLLPCSSSFAVFAFADPFLGF